MPSFKSGSEPISLSDDGREVWERQPGETPAHYRSFRVYLELGAARRLVDTARKLEMNDSYIRSCARHYRWAERADAHDRDRELAFLEKMTDDRRSVALVHLQMGTAVFAKVRTRMQSLDPEELKPAELVRLMEVALKLQTSALGIPDTTIKVTGDPDQPVAIADATGMTLAERRALLDGAIAEMQRRRLASEPEQPGGGA